MKGVVPFPSMLPSLTLSPMAQSPWLRLAVLWFSFNLPAAAAPYPPEGLSTVWEQPGGGTLPLRVFGDEFYARTTTEGGYTVLFDEAVQSWFYAERAESGKLVSTGVRAGGKVPPGLVPHLTEGSAEVAAKRQEMIAAYAPEREARWQARVAHASGTTDTGAAPGEPFAAPLAGAQAGLTILVQFPDDTATSATDPVNLPVTRTKMERWANETGYTDDGNTGSVKDYFRDQSNGALTLTQLVTAVVTMPRPRSYYNFSDYPSNQTVRPNSGDAGRLLVADAINKLKGEGFDFSGLSVNSSNRVLATSLLFAGSDSGNWAKGLWPHAWSLASDINVGTVAAPRYIHSYQITNLANSTPVIGTFIHELGHLLLDYPDLYDTDSGNGYSEGIGQHCLMGSGNYQNSGKTPAPINLYLKSISGWANITDLTPASLLSATLPSTGNVGYRIRKPGSANEYFLFENRGTGDKWTNGALDRGIMIWHVDTLVSGNRNQQMTQTSHYEVSLEQADGRFDLENGDNRGDSSDFFDNTVPFLTNDTNPDADWWDGSPSNIRAEVTSPAGASMNVSFGGSAPAVFLGVSPTVANFPASGGTFSFSVNASGRWNWSRSSALILTSEANPQTGNQVFTISVGANAGSIGRQNTITLTSGTLSAVFNVVQAGVRIDDYANNAASATVMGQSASLNGTINYPQDTDFFLINVSGSGALTLQTTGTTDTYGSLLNSSGQILQEDDDSGEGANFRISYPVAAGVYYIAVRHNQIDQTGPYTIFSNYSPVIVLNVTPASRDVPGAGGSFDFTVDSNSQWSWTSNAGWVTANGETSSQNGLQTFTYAVASQPAASARSAVITLTSGAITATHTINQAAAAGDDHGNNAAAATLILPESTTPGVIEVSGDEDFFRIVVPVSGTLTLKTTGNLDTYGALRNAAGTQLAANDDDVDANFLITRTVAAGTYYLQVRPYSTGDTGPYSVVSAFAGVPYLTLPTFSATAPGAGGAASVAVSSNAAWSWSISQSWITAPQETATQSNDQSFDYLVAANPLTVSRSATITFSSAGLPSAVLTITQPPAGPAITQQPAGATIEPGGQAVLTVATSAPSATYQWYAGAPGNTTLPVPDAVGNTLRISPGGTMSYWVRLTNTQGTTDSTVAVVTVNTTAAGGLWTTVPSGTTANLRAVIWAGRQFVAVDEMGGIRTSPDGAVWQSQMSGTAMPFQSVAWNGSLLVAVGSMGILTSPNGVVWTPRSSGITSYNHITWSGSAFWAASSSGMTSSSDGLVWQTPAGSPTWLQKARFLEGTFCGVGADTIATSPNGATWSTRLLDPGKTFYDVASNGVQWVGTDNSGRIRRSTDRGLTWSAPQVVGGSALRAAVSDGVGFVVAGQGGALFTSADGGATWTSRVTGTTQTLYSMAWNGTHLVAVGDAGVILRSGGARPAVAGAGYYAWATSHGLTEGMTAVSFDADGDGQSNGGEFIHGTTPTDATQRAALNPEIYMDLGVRKIRLRYPYNPQADPLLPVLQRSSNGSTWSTLTPAAIPDGTGYTLRHEWSAPLTTTGPRALFRFKYLVP
jgi:M6 family metalloprotease-like protein